MEGEFECKNLSTRVSHIWKFQSRVTLCGSISADFRVASVLLTLSARGPHTTHPESRSANINDLFKPRGQNTHADTIEGAPIDYVRKIMQRP